MIIIHGICNHRINQAKRKLQFLRAQRDRRRATRGKSGNRIRLFRGGGLKQRKEIILTDGSRSCHYFYRTWIVCSCKLCGIANPTLLISASDLRTFANVLIQETGDSVAEKTFSAVKAAMGDKIKYCTRGEASEILGVSYPTLHRWEKEKCLIPVRIGRKVLYLRNEVDAFKARGRTRSLGK